ncbi:glutathione S-transferase A-like [Lingula anatina]|uniref:Glutathione S-transferase A-like n=1 Tax=Lingula anatina TaxID=7574 RepID=A0A1S3HX75_LINAN|nr:glutathione S-transferase A-like [Lingula anatina]XP_013390631.1 glutathione S-transferase A-like [Lingula anatina]|eukprot:XP_013390630.1 glutathione S-transferase A-like [Lingula anatina]
MADTGKDMLLYWGSGSFPCWRVMIVLEEKGLSDCEKKLISFSDKGHKSDEILKLNPRGQVPTFKCGDIIINESFAACLYLEDTYKSQGPPLIPSEPARKANVLQRMFEEPTLTKKARDDILLLYMTKKPEELDQEKMTKSKAALKEELALWEGYLVKAGGTYLDGGEFTMADAIFFPSLAILVRCGLKLAPTFPKLAAYYDAVSKRPSVEKSWPPHFRDTEGKPYLADL